MPSRWRWQAGTIGHRSAWRSRQRAWTGWRPIRARTTYTFLICLLADERPIGEVALSDLDLRIGSAELGIFIGEVDEWGKGYGTDAVNAIVGFGFAELRLERIWLNVDTENGRARRAYEKAGFVLEATLRHDRYEGGRYTSGHVMSILRDEWLSRSSPPAG